jgi:flagellar basal body-associated protein FliL
MNERLSKSLKVLLGILLVILLAVVAYVLLIQKNATGTGSSTPISSKATTSTINQSQQRDPNAVPTDPAIKALDDQVKAGTLTEQEAWKKMDALRKAKK